MKLKLTPLNIITALAFAYLMYSLFNKISVTKQYNMGVFYKFILLALILVTFVSDLIFRFTLKNIKKIWLVELAFICFTVIVILILKK